MLFLYIVFLLSHFKGWYKYHIVCLAVRWGSNQVKGGWISDYQKLMQLKNLTLTISMVWMGGCVRASNCK